MTLANQDASMMVALGESELENLCLETSFQEIFNFQTQNVIELHSRFIQHANTDQATEQGITWKIKFNFHAI